MKYKIPQGKDLHRKLRLLILLPIMIYCIYQIGSYGFHSYKSNTLNNEMQQVYLHNKQQTKNADDLDNMNQKKSLEDKAKNAAKFKDLLSINSDVVAWIKIDGTTIDYPVLRTVDNKYYLDHNIKKEVTPSGSIFMDYRNKKSEKHLNTIVYGHNMKDGSMFKDLTNYKQKAFLKSHPIIELTTFEKTTRWQIFSTYITDINFNYIKTYFDSIEEYTSFLDKIKRRSLHDTGVTVTDDDLILTLSTCTYEFEDAKFAVHAKLIKEND